jgi:diguanylate cyclase (GGDEF)-like protein
MGGDEFALLFTGDEPEDTIRKAHAAVQTTLRPPAHCKKMAVGMSIGVASVPPGIRVSQDEIYRVADIALYRAKERKELFTDGINIVRRVMEAATPQQDSVA